LSQTDHASPSAFSSTFLGLCLYLPYKSGTSPSHSNSKWSHITIEWEGQTVTRKIPTHYRYYFFPSQSTQQLILVDFHPDPFYKPYASTEKEAACHRGEGPAGIFGAETTDCDSPISLVNATFQWVNDNLKDSVDFVIWTGDSARHDSDDYLPRTEEEIVTSNEMLVAKFVEVFGKEDNINHTDPTNDLTIPIIPTFGNNDIMPHNIFQPGPNKWTKHFAKIWSKFIPEEQRHGFERGGWFFVEVIPNQLAVFSLNTMYFFNSNTAVDGCARKSEPGYEHMEWLRIKLQQLRERGMKAILTGHVPPARTENKASWDETCWQKYTLWMQQYRDVIVGSVYGHMNMDHFLLQGFEDVNLKTTEVNVNVRHTALDDELTIQASGEYLVELRDDWSKIPDDPRAKSSKYNFDYLRSLIDSLKGGKEKKSKEDKYLEKIGGIWAEHYSICLVTASIVPNYFPTMRVVEYNISGLDTQSSPNGTNIVEINPADCDRWAAPPEANKKQHVKIPSPPSISSPPGPAYSPQLFSWTGYTQYYANLTHINNDFPPSSSFSPSEPELEAQKHWHKGKHPQSIPPNAGKGRPQPFDFVVEYDTRNDTVYKLPDLSVRSMLKLARRIGSYTPPKQDRLSNLQADDEKEGCDDGGVEIEKKKHKHKKGKKHHHKHKGKKDINGVWFTFLSRAFVSTRSAEELREDFE